MKRSLHLALLSLLYLGFAAVVVVRRLFRGAMRPGWTLLQEATIGFIRWLIRRIARKGTRRIRRVQSDLDQLQMPRPWLLSRVDLAKVDVAGIPGEWITPKEDPGDTILYYLHGGGYVSCSLNTHRHLIARLALASGTKALGINYRLAPQHPFPAALEDALTGYRWLTREPGGDGVDRHPAKRIVLAGDSAGGGLVLATLMALRDAGDPLPAAAVLISPWVDLTGDDDTLSEQGYLDYIGDPLFLGQLARLYLGHEDPRNPLASPVYGDLSRLPPLLIHAGGLEILQDQIERLAEKASKAGVETRLEVWSEMVHVFHAFDHLFPQAGEAIEQIGSFIRERP